MKYFWTIVAFLLIGMMWSTGVQKSAVSGLYTFLFVVASIIIIVMIIKDVNKYNQKKREREEIEKKQDQRKKEEEERRKRRKEEEEDFNNFIDSLSPSRRNIYDHYKKKKLNTIDDITDEELELLNSDYRFNYVKPMLWDLINESEKRRQARAIEREKQRIKESTAGKLIEKSICKVDNSQNYPGVYLIVNNKTLDFYVGESQNISFRRLTHLGEMADPNKDHHRPMIQKHYDQYSADVFDFYVLERVNDDTVDGKARKSIETFYIKEYQPTYNTDFS